MLDPSAQTEAKEVPDGEALMTRCFGLVDDLLSISDKESRQLDLGDTEGLSQTLDRKRDALIALEGGLAELNRLGLAGSDRMEQLGSRLAELRARAQRDMERAQVKTEAIRKVLHEVKKVRERHGLGGLYGADGRRLAGTPLPRAGVDRSL